MKNLAKIKLLRKFLFSQTFQKLNLINFMSLASDELYNFIIFINFQYVIFKKVHNNEYNFKENIKVLTKPHIPYFSKLI